MESIPNEWSRKALGIVAAAGDPCVKLTYQQRKRQLVCDLAALLDADVWIWSRATAGVAVHSDAAANEYVDGGWQSDRQRAEVLARLLEPHDQAMLQPIAGAMEAGRSAAFLRRDLAADESWNEQGADWRSTGLDEFVVALTPAGDKAFGCLGFFRRSGRPGFEPAAREIVLLVCQQVGWLHRCDVKPPQVKSAVGLPPRVRESLVHLLSGKTKRATAEAMEISPHTVSDYHKQIFKHFGVKGRNELFAMMLSGDCEMDGQA